MNKGFTIVELLSVIVILGLLIIIVTPTYDTVSDNIKLKTYNSRKSEIKSQVISFVEDYAKDVVYNGNNKTICFTPEFLIRNGIITSDSNKEEYIKNDYTNEKYSGTTYAYIKVIYDENNYKLKAEIIDDEGINKTNFSSNCIKKDESVFE